MKQLFVFFLCLFVVRTEWSRAEKILIVSNLRPRTDVAGNIVDIHDGCLLASDSTFYWYGVSYGNATPNTTANTLRCYQSTDLNSWKDVLLRVEGLPEGVVSHPKVLFNEKTRHYILWFMWKDTNGVMLYASAKSAKPTGPFVVVSKQVKVFNQPDGLGLFNLFADADGTAYLAYSTLRDKGVSVEKLSADYLSSSLQNGGYLTTGSQVGAMFAHQGKYYLLMDAMEDFDVRGTGAKVFVSNRPLDSYVYRRNINRYPGVPAPLATDRRLEPTLYAAVRKNSEGAFASLHLEFDSNQLLDGLKVAFFTGNRAEARVEATNSERIQLPRMPSMEVYGWKNGGWVKINTTSTAMTSSVYTIASLKFDAFAGRHFQLRFASSALNALYVNEVEAVLSNQTLKETPQAFVCETDDQHGLPRIPGQTFGVFKLKTVQGERFSWMADLWGSSSNSIPGQDYTYFSEPLEFTDFGDVEPIRWSDGWSVVVP